MKQANQIKQKIKKAKNILLLQHNDPDGDALGSAIVLAGLLKKINKKAVITKLISAEFKSELEYFIKKYKFVTKLSDSNYDLVIALDTATVERLPAKIKVDINIDHPADNDKYAKLNIIDKKAAAVGIIIYELCQNLKVPLTKAMAEGLYLSVYTDTGKFSFANTDQKVFEAAQACLELGVNAHQIYKIVSENKELKELKDMGQALASTESFFDGRLIVGYIPRGNELDNRTLIDYIRQEKNSKVAAVLVEKEKFVKLSLRSKDGIDVSKIARAFHGGGHPFAAAGKIFVADLAGAKTELLKYFQDHVF